MRAKSHENRKPSTSSLGILAIAGFAMVFGLTGCGDDKPVQESVRPVKAMVVQEAAAERLVTYSGVLAARVESALGFRVSGKITERLVNVGDRVQRGQTVAKLDETDLKLSENSARASVNSARTRLAVATDSLERAQSLLPKGYIAQSVADQRQLEVDSAKAALNSAQDQLAQAVNATGYAKLVADKDGIVTLVQAEPGQVVAVGQAVITLAQAGDVEAAVAVPEHEVARIVQGQAVEIALWSAPDIKSEGKVREIAGAADTASRTYPVRVSVARPVPAMRLGMTAAVTFRLPASDASVIVPVAAITGQDGNKSVFVADRQTETVSARPVDTQGLTENGVRVSAGLKPGDIVVTGGVQFLRDGMKVRLPKEITTAAVAVNEASAQR
jgi:RND family efflux transporter MFP subunit